MVVSQVDQDQIKKLEVKDSKKKHRVKHMHSPMNLNCLNHLVILRWPICDMYLSSFITGEFGMLAVITGEFRMLVVITGEFRKLGFICGEFRMLEVITGEFRMLEVITSEIRMLAVITGEIRMLAVITGEFRMLEVITGEFRMLEVITGEFRKLGVITGEFRMINFFHVLSKVFTKVQAGRTKDVFIWMKQWLTKKIVYTRWVLSDYILF